ncbi:MAG: SRPBCC family protein [Burkholderiales bacterium]
MKKVACISLGALLLAPIASFAAQPLLTIVEIVEINAKPAEVWAKVSKFEGLINWCPPFAKSDIVAGKDGVIGAKRSLTVKDGPTFTENLLAFDPAAMTFSYDFDEPAPLPVMNYFSSMGIKPNASGGTTVAWQGSFKRRNSADNPPEGESDAGVVGFIGGLYKACLGNLKTISEK